MQKIQFHRIWSVQECPFAAHKDEELVNTVEKFGKLNPLEYKVKGQILANLWKNLWTLDNGQRYEVELPFKDDCLPILDNYNLSLLQPPEIYAVLVEQDSGAQLFEGRLVLTRG